MAAFLAGWADPAAACSIVLPPEVGATSVTGVPVVLIEADEADEVVEADLVAVRHLPGLSEDGGPGLRGRFVDDGLPPWRTSTDTPVRIESIRIDILPERFQVDADLSKPLEESAHYRFRVRGWGPRFIDSVEFRLAANDQKQLAIDISRFEGQASPRISRWLVYNRGRERGEKRQLRGFGRRADFHSVSRKCGQSSAGFNGVSELRRERHQPPSVLSPCSGN